MSKKRCIIYETLGKVNNLVVESSCKDNLMRLTGVFGVVGIKNENNRIYDHDNYAMMVEGIKAQIASGGCPGELEHPNSMNIDLNNVSHKIESISMNSDGTVTGTICLLDTPKGRTARAIVEGGLPLYISSRGSGSVDNNGHVMLSTIKTYDLVGTPGFSQARLNLAEGQCVANLNESLSDDQTNIWAIYEEDASDVAVGKVIKDAVKDVVAGAIVNSATEPTEPVPAELSPTEPPAPESTPEPVVEPAPEEEPVEDSEEDESKQSEEMEDLKKTIETLVDKVDSLEAQLHVAKESLAAVRPTDYEAIEKWVKEEFGRDMEQRISTMVDSAIPTIDEKQLESLISENVKKWVANQYSEKLDDYLKEHFAPMMGETIQKWITEEYSGTLDGYLKEQFAPAIAEATEKWVTEEYSENLDKYLHEHFAPMVSEKIQNWVTEEYSENLDKYLKEQFAPTIGETIQEWVTNEYSDKLQGYLKEHFAPTIGETIQEWVTNEYSNALDSYLNSEFAPKVRESVMGDVQEFMENTNKVRLENIDNMLDAMMEHQNNTPLQNVINENKLNNKYVGVACIEQMPAKYEASFNLLSEARKDEIIRSAQMYDFSKKGTAESFWDNVSFEETIESAEPVKQTVVESYYSSIVNGMRKLGNASLS